MSERNISFRAALCRIVAVLLLAATAAACDRCGNFAPLGSWADLQPAACRDEAPKLR